MIIKRGIAVSPGVVSGPALIIGTEDFRIPYKMVRADVVEGEVEKVKVSLAKVAIEIAESERVASERIGKQYGAIFGAHLMMAQDPKLANEIEELIRQRRFSAEFASSQVLRKYAKQFQDLGDTYFAERATDIFDLEKRILRHLLGERREDLAHLTSPVIVLSRNLTPSETAGLNRKYVKGFATEIGGHTSHTAILAGALSLPAVVGLGSFLSEVSGGQMVILDGNRGEIIIDPDDETLDRYKDSAEEMRSVRKRFELLRGLEASTKDGLRIQLQGNIEFPEETEMCMEHGADGIGLYRTEFLYLGSSTIPSEEDHYEAYRKVIAAMNGKPITIRTLDIGADKIPGYFSHLYNGEANAALGLRSIRLSLQELTLFKIQLRAILRAAVGADVGVMFPLVSTLLEFRQARATLLDVMEDLEEQGIEFNRHVRIGMMVEVPAAAIMAREFAAEVDFFSVGTNDLIQYTLAADRSDPAVAKWFNSGDPAIMRLLKNVGEAAVEHDISASICGQICSDPKFIPVLIGLKFKTFSVSPQSIPEIKEVIRSLDSQRIEEITRKVFTFDSARSIETYLQGELIKLCPEVTR
ncbi:phosphoenolpyruvate--protein phosphotransferase [Lacunimicrobium album]